MSRNKKPRKPYQERQLRTPMTSAARDHLAMQIHGIVASFIHEPTPRAFNLMLTYMSIASRAVMNETRYKRDEDKEYRLAQFVALMEVADTIYKRHEETGELTVTAEDKDAYGKAALAVDGMLAEIDYSTFLVAKSQIYGEMAERGFELEGF